MTQTTTIAKIEVTSISKVTRKIDGSHYWVYNVLSASGKTYALWVTMSGDVATCFCPDCQYRQRECKHMRALQEEINLKKEQQAAVAEAVAHLAEERKETPVSYNRPSGTFIGPDGTELYTEHMSDCDCEACVTLHWRKVERDMNRDLEQHHRADVQPAPALEEDSAHVEDSIASGDFHLDAPLNGNSGFSLLRQGTVYRFSIDLFDISDGETASRIETFTGQVEAERYSSACISAWPLINARCEELRDKHQRVGVGDLHARIA